jgi:hypothetical protein
MLYKIYINNKLYEEFDYKYNIINKIIEIFNNNHINIIC